MSLKLDSGQFGGGDRWEAWNGKRMVFALYLLLFQGFRWSGILLENGYSNCSNKSSNWPSKVPFFEILWGFETICFLMIFFGSAKSLPQIENISDFARQHKIWAIFGRGRRERRRARKEGVPGRRKRRVYWRLSIAFSRVYSWLSFQDCWLSFQSMV